MWLILVGTCLISCLVLVTCSLMGRNKRNVSEHNNVIEPDYAFINDILEEGSIVSSVARLRTNDEEGYMKIKISYRRTTRPVVDAALKKESDYAKIENGVLQEDSESEENDYSKVRRPPKPPIRHVSGMLEFSGNTEPIYDSVFENEYDQIPEKISPSEDPNYATVGAVKEGDYAVIPKII